MIQNANNLVIDLTHGGVKIAVSLAKKGEKVFAYDIYNTLKSVDKKMLEVYDIRIITLDDLKSFTGDLKVISPVHLPLTDDDIKKYNPNLNYTFITHHQAVKEILSDWGKDILKIEVTGVKGKTSSVFMLKEILNDKNPLILSSLGAILYEDNHKKVLKKNISITPANIKETIDLAYKIANPVCEISKGSVKSPNNRKYSSAIFESSLGVSGIGNVGLLTNISENYPIAQNRSSASEAKKQVFNCEIVACEKESFDEFYSDITHNKVNTFSLTNSGANLYLKEVMLNLDESIISVEYSNIKTLNEEVISGEMEIKSFAPGMHHVSNILGVITTALSAGIDKNKIIDGLKNYKGLPGRTNKKTVKKSVIIEEINPGINTTAIRQSIEMIENLDEYYVAIGGDYGITCEEIDENKVADYLDKINCDLILTGDVGYGIYEKMEKTPEFIKDYKKVYSLAIENEKNLLFIYRSNYKELSKR